MKQHQKPVRRAVADYFNPLQLSSEQLAEIRRIPPGKRRVNYGWLAVAALLLVLLGPVQMWQSGHDALPQLIAREVVKNHSKLKPLEITGSMEVVSGYFKQLPFRPFLVRSVDQSLQLEGGRYCSIQGVDAAQLRFSDPQDKLYTLYQVVLSSEQQALFPERSELPMRIEQGGYDVSLWREQDILQVLVAP